MAPVASIHGAERGKDNGDRDRDADDARRKSAARGSRLRRGACGGGAARQSSRHAHAVGKNQGIACAGRDEPRYSARPEAGERRGHARAPARGYDAARLHRRSGKTARRVICGAAGQHR